MMSCPIPGLLENGNFTNISAYFLGAILSGDESYRLYGSKNKIWLAVVKHNVGYCSPNQLQQHHDALATMAGRVQAKVFTKKQLVDRNWFTPNKIGFAVGFESDDNVTAETVISFAKEILPSLSSAERECLLLGAFDGRCSIDVNKTTGDIRYLVLDCGNNQAMDFFCSMLDKLYVKYNCNYARDRLEGGLPRKPQLRIAASSVGIYAQRIGFISTARTEILARAMGSLYEIVDDSDTLPSKIVFNRSSGKRPSVFKQPVVSTVSNTSQTSSSTIKVPIKPPVQEEPKIQISVGDSVTHKAYGAGVIATFDGKYLTVDFNGEVKKFAFPSAFTGGFLKTNK